MNYFLGIDIGTTSVKAVAFSEEGEVLESFSSAYKMYHPKSTWSEQIPDEVFRAVVSSSNKVISALPDYSLKLVAFSCALHGVLVTDKNDQPITNCIIWADNRAGEIADRLKNTEWGMEVYHTTGVPIHAMSPFCKLIWLKENQPSIFNKANKFISIKEYLFFKLFNEYHVDTSVASATGLLNLKTLDWDRRILHSLDITPSNLSKVVSVRQKYIYNKPQGEEATSDWLVADGTPFIIGGSDGALANIGTGAVDAHSMAISIGTSGAARIIVEAVETDANMRTFCYHIKDNLFIAGGATNNGAVVLEWLKDNLLETGESFPELFQKASTIKPGSEELIFIPYILGERAPVWNSKAKGIFFGLTINHTKAHLIRACMEGVIFSLYSIAKILLEKRAITEIHATGGFTNSPLWLQMLSDMCNIKVLVSGAVESSALGAVIIGMEAMKISPFEMKQPLSCYEPDLLNHENYRRSFEKFERIYQALKNEMANESTSLLVVQPKY